MIYRLIILLILTACGEFNYSPYQIDVDNSNLNKKNLQLIYSSDAYEQKSLSFKIAIISDTHDYYDGLEKQVSYINKYSQQFDFVLVTGDMSNVGLVSEFEETKKRLKKLKIPFLTTSGNHDLLIDGRSIYQKIFGEDTYAFEYKDTKFILYNNNKWESSSNITANNCVEHERASNTQSNLILRSHNGPNDTDRFTSKDISLIEQLVNRYSVDYYINGHNHNPGESTFGNAIHLTAGASSKSVLLELTINQDGVSHDFISL
jgi:predicted phosphodiesterase